MKRSLMVASRQGARGKAVEIAEIGTFRKASSDAVAASTPLEKEFADAHHRDPLAGSSRAVAAHERGAGAAARRCGARTQRSKASTAHGMRTLTCTVPHARRLVPW